MALGHKKFCDSRRFFEGRLHHTRISNPPHVKLACKWRWGIKNSATAEGFLREGNLTPGYPIRPHVKLACKRMLQNKKQATIVDCFLREGYTTPGYPIRLMSSSLVNGVGA
jgi:hypothetical protein